MSALAAMDHAPEEPAMRGVDDLLHEAHHLAEDIRCQRLAVPDGHGPQPRGVAAMEARFIALWTAIRLARASGTTPQDEPSLRRTRPKWE